MGLDDLTTDEIIAEIKKKNVEKAVVFFLKIKSYLPPKFFRL